MAKTADILLTAVKLIDELRFDQAEALARRVLSTELKNAGALHVLGVVAKATGRIGLAIDSLRAAIAIDDRHAGLHFELAAALEKAGSLDAAVSEYLRAIDIWPDYQEAHLNAGALLDRLDRHAEALESCQSAVRLKDDCAIAWFNLGNVHRSLARFDQALAAFDRAIAIEPKFAQAHWNRGCCHLLLGNLGQGWEDYRWRGPAGEVVLDAYPQPLWRGEDLRGKTLLVHAEQGLGDEILFATCLPELIVQAERCVVVCEPRLQPLLARSLPAAQVLGYTRRKDAAPAAVAGQIDLQIPAGSVPLYVRPTIESFPARQRFLVADPAARRNWQCRYEALGPGLKVGISWRAGGQPVDRRRRTTALAQWQGLFALSGVQFINLQYGDCVQELAEARSQLGLTIHDWPQADPLIDLDGFAAKVAALDLVISVGNATVHLAGALGKPTWALLPRVPGWRWGLHGHSSPWYPSVRLLRQTEAGDWTPVFAQAAHLLADLAQRRSAGPIVAAGAPREAKSTAIPFGWSVITSAAPSPAERQPVAITRLSDLPALFVEARSAFAAGDLSRSETLCQQILDHAPRDPHALHLLASIARQTGRTDLAIRSLERLLAVAPNDEKTYNTLGSIRLELGDVAGAASAFRRATELNPGYMAAINNLGHALQVQGDWPGAIDCYRRALELDANCFQAAFNLAGAMAERQQLAAAEPLYRRALELRPGNSAALAGLARALQHLGNFAAAIESYDAALLADPNLADIRADRELARLQMSGEVIVSATVGEANPDATVAAVPVAATLQDLIAAAVEHSNAGRNAEAEQLARQVLQCDANHLVGQRILSICARREHKLDEAVAILQNALRQHPNSFLLHFDMGCTLNEMYRPQDAYAEFLNTIELHPKFQPAYINLGGILEQQERYEESLVWIRKALEINPDCHLSNYNMANSLRETGDVEQAIQYYRRAVEIRPSYARAAWNLGICYLHLGDFENGWPLFEQRTAAEEVMLDRHPQPRWDGSSLAGKSIVVHAEQGVGDEILFASCFGDVISQAERTTLICDPRLQRLFARSFPQATVVAHTRRTDWSPPALSDTFDFQVPAGSLPGHLRPTTDSFPQARGFLTPDPLQVAEWKSRFDALGTGLKIGISWRAGGKPLERRKRTITLERWRDIFAAAGAHFINLQYSDSTQDLDEARQQLGVTIHDWEQGDPLVDLDSYAAKLAALDLVISVGNATVHMAGAVGTPAWTLLPMVPSWRWMVRGQQSLWYPSVRLFRQPQRDQWQPVLDEIASMLAELIASQGTKTPATVQGRSAAKGAKGGKAPSRDKNQAIAKPATTTWLDPSEFSAQVTVESITAEYEAAHRAHQSGEFDEAERRYRHILQIAPRHLKSLQGLGNLARQTGRLELAIRSLQRAVAMVETYAPAHSDLGGALCDSGRLDEAQSSLERALALDPQLASAYVELGVVYQRRGQHDRAIEWFRKAVGLQNNDASLFLHWGRSLAATCQIDKAVRSYEQAIRLRSNYPAAHFALGQCYLDDQRYEDADACFRQTIALDPNFVAAHQQLGCALQKLGRDAEASVAWRRALEIDERDVASLVHLATAERQIGHAREALELLRRALAAQPQRADLHTLLGSWLQDEGELASAIEEHDKALAIAPDLAIAHAQRGLALLQWGNYGEGWQEYEWRWRCPHTRPRNFFAQPRWDGSPLVGKSVLIHAEQGVGDEIMFASCYADVLAAAEQVAITCEPRLERLWQRSFPQARIFAVPRGREHLWRMPADCRPDVQIAAGSLPQFLRKDHADFPRPDHYLLADERLVARWGERFAALGPGLKVGISWRAGELPHDRLRRSAELKLWQPLLEIDGIHFINLQYGDCREELAALAPHTSGTVHHWQDADNLRDLDGLAARIAAVDLVVSVGNTTVHLAGSLGVPTFNLLPQSGGWRWLAGETESPWYRSVRLYRQCRLGDWQELFTRVRQDLLTRQKLTAEVPQMRTIGRPHWNQAAAKTKEA